MVFDADDVLRALEPPRFHWRGRTYTGRLLSYEEWLGHTRAFERVAPDDRVAERRAVQAFLRAVFPRPWWAPWRRSVAAIVGRLPRAAQLEALLSFCSSLALAHGAPAPVLGRGPSSPTAAPESRTLPTTGASRSAPRPVSSSPDSIAPIPAPIATPATPRGTASFPPGSSIC